MDEFPSLQEIVTQQIAFQEKARSEAVKDKMNFVETNLKTSFKKRRKSLTKTITSQQGTKNPNETGQNLDQEFVDEISVLTETG